MDLEVEGIHAVVFPATTGVAIEAKSYWQHTGEIVTSRRGKCRTPSVTFGSTVTLSPPLPSSLFHTQLLLLFKGLASLSTA